MESVAARGYNCYLNCPCDLRGYSDQKLTNNKISLLMRKLKLLVVIFFALLFVSSCSRRSVAHRSRLTWEENFDQAISFDSNRWVKIPRGKSDWNRYMSYFDSCYAMRNGKLVLRGMANNGLVNDTARYLTGGVYTKDKVSFGFGRLEISARLNGAKGA